MRSIRVAMAWMGILVVTASVCGANGFRNPPAGAAALATDGGKIAFIDDASAVVHNPANLMDAEGASAMVNLTLLRAEADYESPVGAADSTRDPWKAWPEVFAVWPLGDGRCMAGVGVSMPYGQSTEWPRNSPFKYQAPDLASLSVVNVNPTLATRLGEQFTAGVGLDIYFSELELKQDYPWAMVTGRPTMPDGRARLTGDGETVSGNLGLTWQMDEQQRLAFTWRPGFTIDYDGDFWINNIPPGAPVLLRSDFSTEIDFPTVVTFGYGTWLTDDVQVGMDVEWVEFSKYDEMRLDLGRNAAAGLFPEVIPQEWNDIWTAGIAATWHRSDQLALRCSYKFMESPIPNATFSPTLPDGDKHIVAVGFGYTEERHTIDFAYQADFNEDRTISGNVNPAFDGEYEIETSHILALSYAYAF